MAQVAPSRVEIGGVEMLKPKKVDSRVLVTRRSAKRLLDCSTATVIRLEQDGLLVPIKLSRKPTSKVRYELANVLDVAKGQ
jgi:hypothetical protein